MEILNYTGRRVGLTDQAGNPIEVLPFYGNAKVEIEVTQNQNVGRVPIFRKKFGRVKGLPSPSINLDKFYIVDEDVAVAVGNTRFDLLVGEDPFQYEGATFYKHMVNV